MAGTPFYELVALSAPEEWLLAMRRDGSGANPARYSWSSISAGKDIVPPLQITVEQTGAKQDVTFEIAAGAPVLSSRASRIVNLLASEEVDLIPARIEGQTDDFFVLRVNGTVKCLDENRTQSVEKWTKESYRPDRAGEYKALRGIVIDSAAASGRNLFRLWGSPQHIIVSSGLKEAFEEEGITGVRFQDVCSPKPEPAVTAGEAKSGSSNQRRERLYEQLLKPLVDVYGPVQKVLGGVIGFDAGGPVKTCVLGSDSEDRMSAFVTCELAIRNEQKRSSAGSYELFTVCDEPAWGHAMLTRVARLSLTDVLDRGHTVDIVGSMRKLVGTIEGVLLETFVRSRIGDRDYAIFRCVGITRPEMEFGRREGVKKLQERLMAGDAYLATNCRRPSII